MEHSKSLTCGPDPSCGSVAPRDSAPWTIILAAGEGSRLAAITRGPDGVPVPKQFCRFDGQRSLLRTTLERAARLSDPSRQIVVVAEQHERWWGPELSNLPAANVLVQPIAKGTAAGLLLPVTECLRRDARAAVVLLPSDHHVEDEGVVERALRAALANSRRHAGCPVLLGVEPDRPDCGYGWIVPEASVEHDARVARFVEKPGFAQAVALMEQGALWSSFMLCSDAMALLACFERATPSLTRAFRETARPEACPAGVARERAEALRPAYERLPCLDFSRDVLEACAEWARVVSVPACGWTDLGTPERVAGCAGLAGVVVERARELVRRQARRGPVALPAGTRGPSGRSAAPQVLSAMPEALP